MGFRIDAAIAVGDAGLAASARGERNIFFAVFLLFCKVGDVEKRVALQTNIDKCRLHAGKDAGNFAFVNGAGEGVLILALVIDFRELVVFDNRKAGFVGGAGDINFFCHAASFQSEAMAGGGLGGMVRQISARYEVPSAATGTRAGESRDCSEDAADVKLAFGQNRNVPRRRDGGGSEES